MRIQTFEELTEAYSGPNCSLDNDDISERNRLLNKQLYTVIVEGGWLELESLEKWANENINEMPLQQVWYGKLAYDFGCTEYFFIEQENANAFARAVPNIYTSYPNSNTPGLVCKSYGYDIDIPYDPKDPESILLK